MVDDNLKSNLQIIQMREIVEAAVGPTQERTVSLQSNLGDLVEMHMNLSKEVKEFKQRSIKERFNPDSIFKEVDARMAVEASKCKEQVRKLDKKIEELQERMEIS